MCVLRPHPAGFRSSYGRDHGRGRAARRRCPPQTVENTEKTGQDRALRFDLCSDPRNEAAQAFGLTWQLTPEEQQLYAAFNAHLDQANGNQDWELPAPAAFVIDREGIIRWSWVDSNYTRRPEPTEIVAALRNLA